MDPPGFHLHRFASLLPDHSAGPWGWVTALDELSHSRREGHVFWNFLEGEITFPPSFRWHRQIPPPDKPGIDDDDGDDGGLAGDYTDLERLKQAYTTSVGKL
jgi:hypothetical protein